MSEYVENAKFKFAKAKYYYEQMKINFQDILENVISEAEKNGYQ